MNISDRVKSVSKSLSRPNLEKSNCKTDDVKNVFRPLRRPNLKMSSDICARVKEIVIDKLGVEESEVIETGASFVEDLGADSLDTVDLIMEFEKEFGIEIPDDQAETITTVGQACDYIEKNAK